MTNYVLFGVLNVLNIYISHKITERHLKSKSIDAYALSVIVIFGFVSTSLVLWLGVFGLLTAWNALLALTFIFSILSISKKKQPVSIMNRVAARGCLQLQKDSKFIITLALFIGLLSVYVFRGLFDGTHFGWDDLSYHATATAHWLQQQEIVFAPYNYHMYFPFGAEAFTTWFMLPLHNDAFASLSGLYWIILSVTSIASIVYRVTSDATSSLMSGALFLASEIVQEESIARFSSVDLAGTAYMLAALYFLIVARFKENQKTTYYIIMMAIALGLATGTKITYAASSILVFFFAAYHVFNERKRPAIILFGLATIICSIGAFWYIRNILETGNPVFPASLGPFSGPLIPGEIARTKLAYWLTEKEATKNYVNSIIIPHFNYGGLALGFVSIAGFFWAAHISLRRLYKPISPQCPLVEQWPKISPLFFVGLFLLLIYPFLPFSGTSNSPEAHLSPATRYIIFVYASGITLFGCFFSSTSNHKALWMLLIFLVLGSWNRNLPMDFAVAITSALLIILALWLLRNCVVDIRHIKTFTLAIITLLFLMLSFWAPKKEQRTKDYLIKTIGASVVTIDNLPSGSSIAWFGSIQYYQLFGRALQNKVVAIASDGTPYKHLYNTWVTSGYNWWNPKTKAVHQTENQLMENITRQNIEFIVLKKHEVSRLWPAQKSIIEKSSLSALIYADDTYQIFRIHTH